jgi:hypothetical protein
MNLTQIHHWLLLSLFVLLSAVRGTAAAEARYTLTPDEHGMILKTPAGKTMFAYMTQKPAESNLTANSVCCLYPVLSPSGVRVVDFAPGDHRHHRGVFLAWHATTCGRDRADFWGWGSWAPTEGRVIRNRDIKLAETGADRAVIQVKNDWMIGDRVVVEEQSEIAASEQRGVYVIDLDYRLLPKVDFRLDQTAFGGFCVKARQDGQADYFNPAGKVSLPAPHHLKPETDWPAETWYDYVIQLDSGETVGTAVIDHPDNPPSTWHNLKAIAMVNPCIAAPAAVERKAGEPLRLRYRLVIHDGPVPTDLLNELAQSWRSQLSH